MYLCLINELNISIHYLYHSLYKKKKTILKRIIYHFKMYNITEINKFIVKIVKQTKINIIILEKTTTIITYLHLYNT